MTTGRINQVTICGRKREPAGPTIGGSLPLDALPAGRDALVRKRRGLRSHSCKASHTVYQRRGTVPPVEAGLDPLRSCRIVVQLDRNSTPPKLCYTCKTVQPHSSTCRHWDRRRRPVPGASAQPRTAQQARQCLGRNGKPHAAPRRNAQLDYVFAQFQFYAPLLNPMHLCYCTQMPMD